MYHYHNAFPLLINYGGIYYSNCLIGVAKLDPTKDSLYACFILGYWNIVANW